MKKIAIILISVFFFLSSIWAATDNNLVDTANSPLNQSINSSYASNSSDATDIKKIKFDVSNTSKWIDPVSPSSYKRKVRITYNITPNDFHGTIVPTIRNNYTVIDSMTPINVTGGSGNFTWDGTINNKLVKQADNPYSIILVLKDSNGEEVAEYSSNKIFIGRPVIILHGLLQVSQNMKESKLFNQIHKNFYTQSVEYLSKSHQSRLGSTTDDIRKCASNLKSEIQKIKDETGAEKVDIVGYSMGGLVARWYIQEMDGDSSTGKLIMLGTPNHGAESSWVESSTNGRIMASSMIAVSQMKPHSNLIQKLNGNNDCYWQNRNTDTSHTSITSVYITLASNNYLTLGHVHFMNQEILCTAKGDGVVPYKSVRMDNVYNQDISGLHLSLPESESIASIIESILNTQDMYYSNNPFTGG